MSTATKETVFTSKLDIESYMLAVISTGHVSEKTHEIFENAEMYDLHCVSNLPYGWLVRLWNQDVTWEETMLQAGVDGETMKNLRTLESLGYTVLMFDRDGEISPLLVEFEY